MVCWLPGKDKYFSFPRTMAVRWAKRKWTRRKINWRQRRAGKVFTADRSDGCRVIMVYKLTARAPVPVCGGNVENVRLKQTRPSSFETKIKWYLII